jgi:hypothetical protein
MKAAIVLITKIKYLNWQILAWQGRLVPTRMAKPIGIRIVF